MKINTQLKSLREQQLQLTQQQFAALVGMGVATINRYERGLEPTEAHRQLLESLSQPENLLRLLEGKEDQLGAGTHRRLLAVAERSIAQGDLSRVEAVQRKNSDRTLKGKREFDLDRFTEMIRFFTRQGEWKTKLNKLLFYADFFAFRDLGKSLSGTRYVVGHYGPIPDGQEALFAALIETGIIEPREEFVRDTGEPVEKLFCKSDLNRRTFSLKEFQILEGVKNFFSKMTAKDIANYSHEEEAYRSHSLGEPIPYSEAQSLKPIPTTEPTPQPSESLATVAKRLTDKIPVKELEKLPTDASVNLDHYLYGHRKRKE